MYDTYLQCFKTGKKTKIPENESLQHLNLKADFNFIFKYIYYIQNNAYFVFKLTCNFPDKKT